MNQVNKTESNRHERDLARRIGASQTPASGATDGHKGDMVLGNLLIDDKSTVKASHKITRDMLHKISREARESGRDPVLSLSFLGNSMGLAGRTWYCIPENLFLEHFGES